VGSNLTNMFPFILCSPHIAHRRQVVLEDLDNDNSEAIEANLTIEAAGGGSYAINTEGNEINDEDEQDNEDIEDDYISSAENNSNINDEVIEEIVNNFNENQGDMEDHALNDEVIESIPGTSQEDQITGVDVTMEYVDLPEMNEVEAEDLPEMNEVEADPQEMLNQEMDERYGTRISEYSLWPRRPRDCGHLHTVLEDTVFIQHSVKKGLQLYGEDGAKAVLQEL
jgi:hypothetical protein